MTAAATSEAMCTCDNQLQPHDRLRVCPQPLEAEEDYTVQQQLERILAGQGDAPGEDDPGVQHEHPYADELDAGGSG